MDLEPRQIEVRMNRTLMPDGRGSRSAGDLKGTRHESDEEQPRSITGGGAARIHRARTGLNL